jgi:hypothetical protein
VGRTLVRVLVAAGVLVLLTAGYAAAGGSLKIIRLHSGQSVRIGNVKVMDVAVTKVVTVTSPPVTVTVQSPPPPPPPGPKTTFPDGTYRVNTDIAPATYQAAGGESGSCYWERLRGFSGTFGDIIANAFGNTTIVTIDSSDVGFRSSRCGTWTKIS